MRLAIGMMAALWSGAVGAMPEAGCYARIYGERHLAENPDQVVAAMRLRLTLFEENPDAAGADIEAVFANQGHAADEELGGQVLSQSLYCKDHQGSTMCIVDCDGGTFRILRQEDGLLDILTNHLTVGEIEGCGGYSNLAEEIGDPVVYRLYRAENEACEGFKHDER
ncbi:hypothetical protein AADZ90_017505 [Aestuariibius sp. 2305UL40-4]|uniref:hypothetical protein n=1 Tax=Aestuariibius violaceus TaxID=3234132 RepID=UPI00345E5CFD